MDTIITWLVLWWIVASVYWIKHEYDKKEKDKEKLDSLSEIKEKWTMDFKSIVKALIFWFEKQEKEKKSIFKKLLSLLFWWKK